MLLNEPLVSIYILSHNYGHYLSDALESVEKQTYQNIQVIVINDGAEELARSICEEKRWLSLKKSFLYFEFSSAKGLSGSANFALSHVKGKYVLRLDADDALHENAISILVYTALMEDNIDIVYSGYSYMSKDGNKYGRNTQLKSQASSCYSYSPHGACCLIKTRTLKAIGGYSEEIGAQDGYELWLKAAIKGISRYVDLPLFFYRRHSTSLSSNNRRILDAKSKIIAKISLSKGSYTCRRLFVMSFSSKYLNSNCPNSFSTFKSILDRLIRDNMTDRFVINISCEDPLLEEDISHYTTLNNVLITTRDHEALDPSCVPIKQILNSAFEDSHSFFPDYDPDLIIYIGSSLDSTPYINHAIELLLEGKYDSVVSVIPNRDIIIRINPSQVSVLNPGRFEGLTLEHEQLYKVNPDLFVLWSDLLRDNSLLGDNIGYIDIS